MRRFLVVIVAALALAGAAVATDNRLQENRAAAQRDAHRLLSLVRLPKGLQRSAARPRVGGTLVGERSANGEYWAGDQAFWTTHADPRSVITYMRAHRPAGSSLYTWGSGGGPGGTSLLELRFTWPPIGLHVWNRLLTVSVISAPAGASAVVAESQSYWMVPRPFAERVPAGVGSIAITLRIGHGAYGLEPPLRRSTYVVWRRARVAALISAFDALPIVQPGVMYSCPAEIVGRARPALTLAFRAGQAGPALARAEVSVGPGSKGAAGWNMCDPVRFWIGGRSQTPLTSQTFVRRIGSLIGAHIS